MSILGFVTAYLIQAYISGNGNIADGLSFMKLNLWSRRMSIMSSSIPGADEIMLESIKAPMLKVIKMYLFMGLEGKFVLISLLSAVFCCIYQRKILKKNNNFDISLLLVTFLGAISWLILAKPHSYIHTHINFVIWYMGFMQTCVYIGVVIVFLVIIYPLISAILDKNKYIKSEAEKIIKAIEKNKANEKYSEDFYNDMEEGYLQFDNFNFKLAIIQELMYDINVLHPEFDIYEFAKEYKGEEIDTESETVIEPALDYFKNLQIPKSLAKEVGSFYMDGGNEVYMNIIPLWDGEDGYFDLNDVSLAELRQFPNLTEATILTDDFDKIKKIFDAAGIKVELL